MKILKVDKNYTIHNPYHCSYDMHIKMSFFDRLKFLLYGEECIFRFTDEETINKRKSKVEAFGKWRAEFENEANAKRYAEKMKGE